MLLNNAWVMTRYVKITLLLARLPCDYSSCINCIKDIMNHDVLVYLVCVCVQMFSFSYHVYILN